MRNGCHKFLLTPILLGLSFGLIDFGIGINAARSQDIPTVSGPRSCADALHGQLRGENRVEWESSYLADSDVICSTARRNILHLENAGLSQSDVERATFSAWLQLKKSGRSVASVSAAELESVIKSFGLLIVDSEPAEADVTIDASPCSTVTKCLFWVSPGTHEIVISKKGYQTARSVETVTKGRATQVTKTLQH